MKLRTLPILSLLAVGTLALTACTSASAEIEAAPTDENSVELGTAVLPEMPFDEAAAALLPADIAERGYLNAAYSPTFAPFEYYDKDNSTIIGFDVDYIKAVGQVLGLEIKTEAASFDAIIPGLSSGKYDLSNSGIAVTEERKLSNDFVVFAQAGSGIGVLPGNPKNISNDYAALCGLKIAAGKGTIQGLTVLPGLSEECVAAGEKEIDIQLFPSQNDGFLALRSNRIDGYMADSFTVSYQGKLAGDAWELAPGEDFAPITTGITTSKDSPLTPAIRAAVLKIIDSDVYPQMNAKWGIPDTTMVTAEQVTE